MKTKKMTASLVLLGLFLVLILLLKTVDVQTVGPESAQIGLAGVNTAFHHMTGLQMTLYKVTQITGALAIMTVLFFAGIGIYEAVSRKSLKKVDRDLYLLAGLYAALAVCYLFFEKVIINYRPVILDEGLEASFPSSHTMLSVCLLLAAIEQMRRRMQGTAFGTAFVVICAVLLAVTVLGRLFSGVHWLTDILGGLLLGGSLYLCYAGLVEILEKKRSENR